MYVRSIVLFAISAATKVKKALTHLHLDQMLDYIAENFNPEIQEFHISQGHNPHLPFEYYVDCIRQLKASVSATLQLRLIRPLKLNFSLALAV